MARKILTPLQKQFISLFAQNRYLADRFYLTGGTALSAYYLGHRYSEDTDHRKWRLFFAKEAKFLAKEIFK